jgi:hypothetical protein
MIRRRNAGLSQQNRDGIDFRLYNNVDNQTAVDLSQHLPETIQEESETQQQTQSQNTTANTFALTKGSKHVHSDERRERTA